jgi:rRNA maturation RNase YbeY
MSIPSTFISFPGRRNNIMKKTNRALNLDLTTISLLLIMLWRRFHKLSGPGDRLQTREFRRVVECVKILLAQHDGKESLIGQDYFSNREYLGVDAPTDVLSFPASETDPETGAPYLGDILISIPYARKGAKQAGNSLEAEVQLLVVHGVLHLLGHDHAKPKEKARMWKAQREILIKLGLGDVQIREA